MDRLARDCRLREFEQLPSMVNSPDQVPSIGRPSGWELWEFVHCCCLEQRFLMACFGKHVSFIRV
jgi:hypothetical protein